MEHTLARRGAERLRELLEGEAPGQALGASTGNQAVRQVRAGLEAIYVSGWQVPIVADAEAGFGGTLNCFELMKAMIEAGAAGVHFEDQLASEKKCGHMGGKVLLPTAQAVRNLVAARLAADVEGYRDHGMTAYAELQQREFANEENGYTATSHQREVGAGYFDEVAEIISGGKASTGALSGSTEEAQFALALRRARLPAGRGGGRRRRSDGRT